MTGLAVQRLVALISLVAAVAPSPEALAKPRGCFTKAEQGAEEMVRYGLRLREGGTACDTDPWNAGTLPLWQAVDQRFGPQFKQQTDIRAAAFRREFENDAENRLSMWNARIVFYYRNFPLSDTYCAGIKSSLAEMQQKGWNSFVKRSVTARDDIRMIYRPCDQ